MSKKVLFSLTRKDFVWDYFSGTGAGGQHRNRHQNCVRVKYPPSGAQGSSQEHKEKKRNEMLAFKRMSEDPKMMVWLRREANRITGKEAEIKEKVENSLNPKNLLVEIKKDGLWTEWSKQKE